MTRGSITGIFSNINGERNFERCKAAMCMYVGVTVALQVK